MFVVLNCCTGTKYVETTWFLSLTKHVKRELWRKSWCNRCYLVSFSFLQSGPKQLFSIWINFGSFGMRRVPEILKREGEVAEWRFLAASLRPSVERWSDPLLRDTVSCKAQ